MTFSVTMPALGESVTEGTVTRWLKKEGDQIAVDEPLLEVSTDKVDTEIPSPVAGVLQKIVVPVDSTVAVGAELAVIAESGSAAKPAAQTPAPVVAAPVVQAPVVQAPVVQAPVVQAPVVQTPAPVAPAAATAGATIVAMPALGESVTEGTVTRWLKKVGDAVSADEALLEVSTDKVDTEIPSPVSGTVLSIDVPVDTTVAVGARLASIGVSGSTPAPVAKPAPVAPPVAQKPATPAPVVAAPVVQAPVVQAPAPVAAAVNAVRSDDSYVTPIVRKLAAEAGVNLSTIKGTGIGGRIRKEDILAATPRAAATPTGTVLASTAAAPRGPLAVSPLRGTTVTMSRLRKVIADRMVESLKISAQLTTVVEVDVTKIDRLRNAAKASFEAREGVKLTFLPFFAVTVCEALKQHPVLNSSVEGDRTHRSWIRPRTDQTKTVL